MSIETTTNPKADSASWLKRHTVAAYFLLTFAISWTGALAVAAPYLLHGTAIPKFTGILIFPAMLIGPPLAGTVMAGITNGRHGIRGIFAGMNPARIEPRWYAVLLIPPALVLFVLVLLTNFVAPEFTPNHFWLGVAFGVPAGLFEEIGWTGFALPAMRRRWSMPVSAVLLGALWGLWHLPAVNYLGASAPHGRYWPVFFLAFAFAMTAMRVLITWLCENTGSLLLAQLMHISSTGALVIFSPPIGSLHESFWYVLYGVALWVMAVAILRSSRRSACQNFPSSADGP